MQHQTPNLQIPPLGAPGFLLCLQRFPRETEKQEAATPAAVRASAACALLSQRESPPQWEGSLSSPVLTPACHLWESCCRKTFTAHKSQRDILAQAASHAWQAGRAPLQRGSKRGAPWPARGQVRCAPGQDTRPATLLWQGRCRGSVVQPGARCGARHPQNLQTERPALHSPGHRPPQLPAHLSDLWDLHALDPRAPSGLKHLEVSPTTPVPAQALAPKSCRGSGTYMLFLCLQNPLT